MFWQVRTDKTQDIFGISLGTVYARKTEQHTSVTLSYFVAPTKSGAWLLANIATDTCTQDRSHLCVISVQSEPRCEGTDEMS
jgi:hypothetical protein